MQVASLRKVYGNVVAVDDLGREVERGSVFCIIGPNGAGKTTAIECLQGLRQPDGGSVLVAGLDPTVDRGRFVHKIGVQLQEVGIPPRMKAQEALSLANKFSRTAAAQRCSILATISITVSASSDPCLNSSGRSSSGIDWKCSSNTRWMRLDKSDRVNAVLVSQQ